MAERRCWCGVMHPAGREHASGAAAAYRPRAHGGLSWRGQRNEPRGLCCEACWHLWTVHDGDGCRAGDPVQMMGSVLCLCELAP